MRTLLPLTALLLLACEPDPGDSSPDTTDTSNVNLSLEDLAGGCTTDQRVGGFDLAHWDGPDEGFATATVSNASDFDTANVSNASDSTTHGTTSSAVPRHRHGTSYTGHRCTATQVV